MTNSSQSLKASLSQPPKAGPGVSLQVIYGLWILPVVFVSIDLLGFAFADTDTVFQQFISVLSRVGVILLPSLYGLGAIMISLAARRSRERRYDRERMAALTETLVEALADIREKGGRSFSKEAAESIRSQLADINATVEAVYLILANSNL